MIDEIETERPHVNVERGYGDLEIDFVRKVTKTWQHNGEKYRASGLLKFHIWGTEVIAGPDWSLTVSVKPLTSSVDNTGWETSSRTLLEKKFESEKEDVYTDEEVEREVKAFVEEIVNADTKDIFAKAAELGEAGYYETLIERLSRSRERV